jgi:hypothetical protein
VSELHERLGEVIAALAANDASYKRFGAAAHRYQLSPPLDSEAAASLDALALPADYREYIAGFSAGGVGPYYGLLPAHRAAQHLVAAPGGTDWTRALPLSHLGCGYFAVMPLDGPAAGQIWLDARPLELCQPIRPSFTAFVLDWIERAASNQWLDGFVPVGRCALQAALSGYLHVIEESLGLASGQLAGEQLREALAGLGEHSIQIAAEGPLFADGDTVDPCITCARMLDNLAAEGLVPTVVAPGVPPLPAR